MCAHRYTHRTHFSYSALRHKASQPHCAVPCYAFVCIAYSRRRTCSVVSTANSTPIHAHARSHAHTHTHRRPSGVCMPCCSPASHSQRRMRSLRLIRSPSCMLDRSLVVYLEQFESFTLRHCCRSNVNKTTRKKIESGYKATIFLNSIQFVDFAVSRIVGSFGGFFVFAEPTVRRNGYL